MEHNRLVTFDGTVNFRDIGGYENNEGKHVKWNKIYRSDSLSSLTKRDEEKLEEMKVTVDCDLRTSNEQLMAPDRQWNGVEVLDCHVYAEDSSGNFVNDSHKLYRFLHHIPKVNSYLGEIYQNVILSPASQKAFARVFASLLTLPEDEALVYHCSAGKDRTGMTTALILKGLGVDEHTIARDFEPRLSTIVQPIPSIAQLLVKLLEKRIDNPTEELDNYTYYLPVELLKRESSGN